MLYFISLAIDGLLLLLVLEIYYLLKTILSPIYFVVIQVFLVRTFSIKKAQ